MIEWTSEASSTLTVDLGSQGIELKEAGTPVDVLLPAASYGGFAVTIYDTKNGVMLNEKLPAIDIPSGETVSTDVTYEPGTEQVVYLKAKVEKAADGSDFIWNSGSSIYVNGEPHYIVPWRRNGRRRIRPLPPSRFMLCIDIQCFDRRHKRNADAREHSGKTGIRRIPDNPQPGRSNFHVHRPNFRYVAGVVKLTVSGPHAVRTIELQGKNNRRLAGDGMINMTASDFALSLNADASKSITVNCGKSGVPSSRDTTSVSYCLQATTAKADLILTDNIGLVSTFELPGTTVNRNEIASLGEIEWPGGQGGENDLSAYGVANCYMVHTAEPTLFGHAE